MPIPNKLREARKLNGLTQKDVATYLGFTDEGQVSKWEQGHYYPGTEYLFRLCVLYGVYPHQLYGEALREMRKRNRYKN
ncbi:helix-turn-helix transcriptional regulator [Candidatus Nomurabacteria bacterium]|nr:MAG: helix-turn-helix transcriptional regulator [Candidatus Nomurabacteria bacterium]